MTQREYGVLGVVILQNRGFKVCFLDLSAYLNPDYVRKYQSSDLAKNVEIAIIKKKKDLLTYLEKDHKHTFFIDYIGSRYRELFFMFRAFRKYKICYAVYSIGRTPITYPCFKAKIKESIFNGNIFVKIINKLIILRYSLPHCINKLKAPTFILAGGRKLVKRLPNSDRKTKIIWGHVPDYDLYLENLNLLHESPRNYAVFLDDYLLFHPDQFVESNFHCPINADKYYKTLNRFFDHFEKTFNMSIIIAAHPSSQYHLKPNLFCKRKIVKGKTIELVAGSECVLAHYSTAIDFAILYKKPIVFLTSNEIDNVNQYNRFIYTFAKYFGKKPINVDDRKYDLSKELRIDGESYFNYFSEYIKVPGTPEKHFWNIVTDHILTS